MSGKESKKQEEAGYADPLYLSNSDHAAMQISNMVFNGGNFQSWSRSVRLSLGSKNRLGFIEETCKKSSRDSKDYQRWMRCDHMVWSWLFRSMTDRIAESLILCESSKQIWDEIVERYGQTNALQLY